VRVAWVAVALVGCAAPAPQAPLIAPVVPGGFDHRVHSGADESKRALLEQKGGVPGCGDCHVLVDPAQGRLARPGSDQHAPCDRCHKEEFFRAPGTFCKLCHTQVDPRQNAPAGAGTNLGPPSEMQPWPPAGAVRRYAAVFNHRMHLDADKMEQRLGFHAGCRDCHIRQEGEERANVAGHAACAPCHGGAAIREGAARPSLTMSECRRCHVSEAVAVPQGRRFITGDLTFSHAKHEKDKSGKPISCASCHAAVADANDVEHIMLPVMVDCAKCHEDPARTGADKRIANCSLCHKQITAGVAPRNHLGTAAPDTHTIAFRSDHGAAARDSQARCRFCHGGLSSTTKDNCHECHTVMKPRDHTLRWSTTDHGPEAAINRERCATCHEADYCSRCHSQRPRSHVPFDTFVNGGHGVEARLNLRTCFACHTFETNCVRCHNGPAFPGGKVR
jgi:hypothetical protein